MYIQILTVGNLRFIRSGEEEKDGRGMLKMAAEVSVFYLPTNICLDPIQAMWCVLLLCRRYGRKGWSHNGRGLG